MYIYICIYMYVHTHISNNGWPEGDCNMVETCCMKKYHEMILILLKLC